MASISSQEIERAERVLASVRNEWLRRPGVTAVDLGFKWSGGKMTRGLSIRVHVARKKQESELTPYEVFPKDVDGLPVDILEASYAPQSVIRSRPEIAVDGRGRRFEVIPIGVSIGCKYSTAGTLGAKVIDLETGDEMILSNWHVMAGRTEAQAGMSIWQPGWIDGGTREENSIAELSRWILGPYDAAVARLNGKRAVQTKTVDGRSVEDVTAPRLGMLVWKSGRSTGLTQGLIDGFKMTVPLVYPNVGMRMLEQVFRIVPRIGSTPQELSIGGDSGAVWVDEESGKAAGLHFAGEIGDSPEHALAHDISAVAKRLNFRFPKQKAPVNVSAPPKPATDPPSSSPPSPKPPSNSSFWDVVSFYLREFLRSK